MRGENTPQGFKLQATGCKRPATSYRLQATGCRLQLVACSLQPAVCRGFTFVELLIASTMMAVLFLGLAAHLQGGIMVWQRATQTAERLQRTRVALDRLDRDLANAMTLDSREAAYGDDPGKLPPPQFGSQELRWYTVEPDPVDRMGSVRVVTYACREKGGVVGLWRTSVLISQARAKIEPAAELVLPGCERLSVRYGYLPVDESGPIAWREQWKPDPTTALPRLVEVSLESAGYRTRRVCPIPIGTLTLFEEATPSS